MKTRHDHSFGEDEVNSFRNPNPRKNMMEVVRNFSSLMHCVLRHLYHDREEFWELASVRDGDKKFCIVLF